MNLRLEPEPVPLRWDEGQTIRVGQTRVTLDTVVAEYRAGSTAEEIGEDFPTLTLAEVYGTIAFILRHPAEVEAYLARRRLEAAELDRMIPRNPDAAGLRERLLARRAAHESGRNSS